MRSDDPRGNDPLDLDSLNIISKRLNLQAGCAKYRKSVDKYHTSDIVDELKLVNESMSLEWKYLPNLIKQISK